MGRSNYSDDCDEWTHIRWRGAVASSIRGKRGQLFLRSLLEALDSMKRKELIAGDFQADGSFCTLGVAAAAQGVDMSDVKVDELGGEAGVVAGGRLNIAEAMACEIMFMNDEGVYGNEKPAERWVRMRKWIADQIIEPPTQ